MQSGACIKLRFHHTALLRIPPSQHRELFTPFAVACFVEMPFVVHTWTTDKLYFTVPPSSLLTAIALLVRVVKAKRLIMGIFGARINRIRLTCRLGRVCLLHINTGRVTCHHWIYLDGGRTSAKCCVPIEITGKPENFLESHPVRGECVMRISLPFDQFN